MVDLDLVQPGASARHCEIHSRHEPEPLYVELHHYVPRAWQGFWTPLTPPSPAGGLWDNRTIALDRTGHGNVHWWIVAYMVALAATNGSWDDLGPDVFEKADATHKAHLGDNLAERATAQQGLLRYMEVGGDLFALTKAGLYGGI